MVLKSFKSFLSVRTLASYKRPGRVLVAESIREQLIHLTRSVTGPTEHVVHWSVVEKPFVHILSGRSVTSPLLAFMVWNWSVTNSLHAFGGSRLSGRRRTWKARAALGGPRSASRSQHAGWGAHPLVVLNKDFVPHIYLACTLTNKLLILTTV